MWKSIKLPPTQTGIYVVAEFKGDEMIDFNLDYALINAPDEPYYWGPNRVMSQSSINVTHYMSYKAFKQMLGNLPREDNPIY